MKEEKEGVIRGTWQGDVNLEGAAFVRSSDRTRNGADQVGKIIGFGGDSNT